MYKSRAYARSMALLGVVRRAPPTALGLTGHHSRVEIITADDALMNTPLAVPCTMSRFSCVSQQNFASCLRPVVPKMHLHRLARGPQRRVPTIGAKPCGRHHFCCRSSLLDQAWGTHVNAQELATNIFSTSIVPYSAFLYWLTKSKKTPPLALFGFYFLLVFVFATIPAGVIALKFYHKSLANVDFLHGSAESMLTVTNLLIVLGLRQGVRQAEQANQEKQGSQGTGSADSKRPADAAQQQ